MKTFLVRLGFGFTLACLLGSLAGCAGQLAHVQGKPSHVTFKILFLPEDVAKPTGMSISPDGGDVILQVVKIPGADDNKVIWRSGQNFSVRFGQVDDPTQPLKPGRHLGNEKQGWNDASDHDKDGVWEYTLTLSQGNGHTPETVGAKYFVKHAASREIFDPVIIVGR